MDAVIGQTHYLGVYLSNSNLYPTVIMIGNDYDDDKVAEDGVLNEAVSW